MNRIVMKYFLRRQKLAHYNVLADNRQAASQHPVRGFVCRAGVFGALCVTAAFPSYLLAQTVPEGFVQMPLSRPPLDPSIQLAGEDGQVFVVDYYRQLLLAKHDEKTRTAVAPVKRELVKAERVSGDSILRHSQESRLASPAMLMSIMPAAAGPAFSAGTDAKATGVGSVAIGNSTVASGLNTIAVGSDNTVSSGLSAAFGSGNKVVDSGYVVGRGNKILVNEDSGGGGAVFGVDNTLKGSGYQAAIGFRNKILGNGARAIGNDNEVDSQFSQVFGSNSTVSDVGVDSYVIGNSSRSEAAHGRILGRSGRINIGADDSIIVGDAGVASAQQSILIGKNVTVSGDRGVAIGGAANASEDDSVALGSGTTTEAAVATKKVTIAGIDYEFSGVAPKSTVSIGSAASADGLTPSTERTLTHVAAGRLSSDSTDAINGSQLYATNQAVEVLNEGAVQYDRNDDGTLDTGSLTLPGIDTDNDGESDTGTTITNLAEGDVSEGSSDAVNGDQLWNVQDELDGVAADSKYYQANSTGDAAKATGVDSLAMGPSSVSSSANGVAIGNGATVSVANSVALGSSSEATREVVGTSGVYNAGLGTIHYNTADGTLLGEVSVGKDGSYRQVTNVADGIEDHDAVTLRQLKGALGSISDTNELYFHANGLGAGDSLAVGDHAVAVGPETTVNGNDAIGMGYQAKVETGAAGSIAIGDESHTFLEDAVAIGSASQGLGEQSLALGAGSRASQALDVALGAQATTEAKVATGAVTILGTSYDVAGVTPVATVSIGAQGKERTLTHLAAGRVAADSTDAVNGSQLFATHQALNGLVGYDRLDNGEMNWGHVTLGDPNGGGSGTVVDNVAAATLADDSLEAVNGSQLNATNGRVTNLEGDVDMMETVIDEMDGDIGILVESTVQYDAGTDKGQLTLGGDGGTLITNLADGDITEGSSDAVNGGQIWDLMDDIGDLEVSTQDSKYFQANSEAEAARAIGQESVAIGGGAVTEASGGVALGAGAVAEREGMSGAREAFSNVSVASEQGAISVGAVGGERQITHVAGGTEDTDAVNVRQLRSVREGAVNYDRREDGSVDYGSVSLGQQDKPVQIHNVAAGSAPSDAANVGQLNALDRRFSNAYGHLDNKIDKVEREASSGIAALAAMGDTPYVAGKFTYHIGTGYHNGETALGASIRRTADSGRWSLDLGLGAGSYGGPTIGFGVSGVIN